MNLKDFAKSFVAEIAREDSVLVDFTMGNGHDTEYLCSLCPRGHVYSFDIQPQALKNTEELLAKKGYTNAELILSSHEFVRDYVKCEIDGGMFNLGYRPGGDRTLYTLRPSTRRAVEDGISLLRRGGVIAISVYPGHEEGHLEGEMLYEMLSGYDKKQFCIMCHKMINSPDSPYIFIIEKY